MLLKSQNSTSKRLPVIEISFIESRFNFLVDPQFDDVVGSLEVSFSNSIKSRGENQSQGM